VSGTRRREFPGGVFGMPAVLFIKRLEPGQRHDKAQLNDALRSVGLSLG
jgi:2,3,4,5-tetrahydropyridine-2-carboxylate N-succinyltransferase